jgi:hypothetical protein
MSAASSAAPSPTAASRLDNDMMSWLVHRIGPGVPVTIAN